MDWLRTAVLSSASFTLKNLALYGYMTSEVSNPYAEIYEPPSLTSIVLPAYNEEAWIRSTLESLENQNVRRVYPDRFELVVVDSASTDQTAEIAQEFTDIVVEGPRGKLSARHLGILEASGNVIVAVDADCRYEINFLNLLLRHFQDRSVVAVGGPRLSTDRLLNLGYLMRSLLDSVSKRLAGASSAFRRSAYLATGGFRLDIDQFRRETLLQEEEYEFSRRLQQVGKVVFDLQASVITSPRFWYCALRGREYACPQGMKPEICEYCLAIALQQRF